MAWNAGVPLIEKIDHIGIAVHSMKEAKEFYSKNLGLPIGGEEELGSQGVKLAFVKVGESRIELLEPLSPDTPIGKFLAKKGEGLHHIALKTNDIMSDLTRLKESGAKLIDTEPRQGAHGTMVAFCHPSSTFGVLLELVEERE